MKGCRIRGEFTIVIPSVFDLLFLVSPLRRVLSVGYRAVCRLAIEVDRISLRDRTQSEERKEKPKGNINDEKEERKNFFTHRLVSDIHKLSAWALRPLSVHSIFDRSLSHDPTGNLKGKSKQNGTTASTGS